jgi:hypothetical protein
MSPNSAAVRQLSDDWEDDGGPRCRPDIIYDLKGWKDGTWKSRVRVGTTGNATRDRNLSNAAAVAITHRHAGTLRHFMERGSNWAFT